MVYYSFLPIVRPSPMQSQGNFQKYFYEKIFAEWMLRRVALVRTDVSEELSASFIRTTRIGTEEDEVGGTCGTNGGEGERV
jgi:hypothetical protein